MQYPVGEHYEDNVLEVSVSSTGGQMYVKGLDGTTINGGGLGNELTFGLPADLDDIRISLRGGDDALLIKDFAIDDFQANMGSGNDGIIMQNINVGDDLREEILHAMDEVNSHTAGESSATSTVSKRSEAVPTVVE